MSIIQLTTTAFGDHESIPDRFAKDHEDLSPPLAWGNLPAGTVELVITCEDPDAPGGTFIHWLAAGIDPGERGADEGKPPPGAIDGRNSYGDLGYGGPQPPLGDEPHRYFFRVHACNEHLGLKEGFSNDELQRALAMCEIGTGTVVGVYRRP